MFVDWWTTIPIQSGVRIAAFVILGSVKRTWATGSVVSKQQSNESSNPAIRVNSKIRKDNPMGEREAMINLLLQACDQKNAIIAGLQAKVAEHEKAAAAAKPVEAAAPTEAAAA